MSQIVAASEDWSRVGEVRKGEKSPLFERYHTVLQDLAKRFFPHDEGDIYLAVLKHGEQFVVASDDSQPMDDNGPANPWEVAAYALRKTTFNSLPYSDSTGTYLAAQTPIFRDGKVVGLVAAEYDSATLSDFQELVGRAFWLSILPAVTLALIVAYVLAGLLVEPMEIFRRIDETARLQLGNPASPVASKTREDDVSQAEARLRDPLEMLTPREREVAELVRQGMTRKAIADQLGVAPETVKQHAKNIREKTGLSGVNLAVQVEANRIVAAQRST